jgi:hypothetical protein
LRTGDGVVVVDQRGYDFLFELPLGFDEAPPPLAHCDAELLERAEERVDRRLRGFDARGLAGGDAGEEVLLCAAFRAVRSVPDHWQLRAGVFIA